MKKTLLSLLAIFSIVALGYSQSMSDKIVARTCSYLKTIEGEAAMQDSIQPILTKSFAELFSEFSATEKDSIRTAEGMRSMLKESHDKLLTDCYAIRKASIDEHKAQYYGLSNNEKATQFYEKGNKHLTAHEYDKAMPFYERAIAFDPEFVYAIDHLAICYRRLENYEEAIKHYKQSLAFFPEGDTALLNIAVVYGLLEDYKEAANHYALLKYYYPDNPEGYFGLARMLTITKDYEPALDNLFSAHIMYYELESDYIEDSTKLIQALAGILNQEGKLDLLYDKAKEYGINLTDKKED